ncbi:YceD family protein [Thermophagus sp. OGC60D27]|uniref:YceD family protein n=1 Tax=Thermophagus sp. OGC60D27 TaxID=3458415 RepID=UPI00403775AC
MAAERKKKFSDYDIAFKGLKAGKHVFEYELKDPFFELFEQPQIETGELAATVELTKHQSFLELTFRIDGFVGSQCDRCLELMQVPIFYEGTLFVKFGETYDEPDEDIIVLPHEDHKLNIARYMYEYIVVSIPVRHVHPDKDDGTPGCDPEMLDCLNDYVVEEDNFHQEENSGDQIDPRWNELKKLINKNNK